MTATQTFDEVLEHYGIKGMKWGVRRTREQLARARGERKQKKAANTSDDAKRASEAKAKARKGGVSALSNSELQALTQRMNLETQYSNLSKSQRNAGEKMIDDMLKELGKQHSKEAAKWVSQQAFRMILKDR